MVFEYEILLVEKFIELKMTNNAYERECPFRWGNIDLVEYKNESKYYLSENQIKVLKQKENLIIFSLLYKHRQHKLDYISKKSGFSLKNASKHLNSLIKSEIVVQENNLYRINGNIEFPDVLVKSYEMKLNDIKKAINQAVINKKYSDYSYVVMPQNKYKLCMEYKNVFQNCSVGLLLVSENKVTEVIRAKKNKESTYAKFASKIKLLEAAI